MKSQLPKQFYVTITEEDRQNADLFCDGTSCLVATALKRMGFKKVREGVFWSLIDGIMYRHRRMGAAETHKYELGPKPHYGKEVVGTKFRLTRVDEAKR